MRCFTFAAVFDMFSGSMLAIGSSYVGCAERQALWKLNSHDDATICSPKVMVVCRVRRNRNNKRMSYGLSKPCQSCIQAMTFYNVVRVAYSANDTNLGLQWECFDAVKQTYEEERELKNEALARALEQGKRNFTRSEWRAFGILDLKASDRIVTRDGECFVPSVPDGCSEGMASCDMSFIWEDVDQMVGFQNRYDSASKVIIHM